MVAKMNGLQYEHTWKQKSHEFGLFQQLFGKVVLSSKTFKFVSIGPGNPTGGGGGSIRIVFFIIITSFTELSLFGFHRLIHRS